MPRTLRRGDDLPREIIANNVWVEFTSTLQARYNHIEAKATWWRYRSEVHRVPIPVADQKLADIETEQNLLLSLLPDWERPTSSLTTGKPRVPFGASLLGLGVATTTSSPLPSRQQTRAGKSGQPADQL